jgi:hypothetical protein
MGKANRKAQRNIFGALSVILLVFLVAPSAYADQINNTPSVGDVATLNLNESLILKMNKFASVVVGCKGIQAKMEFYGTNSQNKFEFKSKIPIPMATTRFNSETFWSRDAGGGNAMVKFKCIKTPTGKTVKVTIISLTPK